MVWFGLPDIDFCTSYVNHCTILTPVSCTIYNLPSHQACLPKAKYILRQGVVNYL